MINTKYYLMIVNETFIFAFISMITIINPFSTASVFMAITKDYSKKEKVQTAIKATIIAISILLVFGFGGRQLLNFFSISIEGIRLAGGLLLATLGMKMINQKRKRIHSKEEHKELMEREDITIIPLAIPFISGPGTIATLMLLIHDASTFGQSISIIAATIVACLITGIAMIESRYFEKLLGVTGNKVISKVMGLIVLVIGIEFFIKAIHNILLAWGLII